LEKKVEPGGRAPHVPRRRIKNVDPFDAGGRPRKPEEFRTGKVSPLEPKPWHEDCSTRQARPKS